jgi:hypothetical protein
VWEGLIWEELAWFQAAQEPTWRRAQETEQTLKRTSQRWTERWPWDRLEVYSTWKELISQPQYTECTRCSTVEKNAAS